MTDAPEPTAAGRIAERLVGLAVAPVVAVLDVAIGACDRHLARRRAPALIAGLEADLRDAAARW